MNINKLNSFVCNFWQKLLQSTILVMEHADVRPCFTSDFQQDLQTEKCARSLERMLAIFRTKILDCSNSTSTIKRCTSSQGHCLFLLKFAL